MKLDSGTRTRILDDIEVTIDPTDSTVEVGIRQADGTITWYPAEWLDDPVQTSTDPDEWTQTAQTTGYFAGPDADASGATVLALGRHLAKSRVSKGQDILTSRLSQPIEVV